MGIWEWRYLLRRDLLFAVLLLSAISSGRADDSSTRAASVDRARLVQAEHEPAQWLTGGRDYKGTFHSPLADINASNVERLGFAWEYVTGLRRGLQATPIVVDGVLYTSGNWGTVYALNAASGQAIWTFEPEVDHQYAMNAAVDVVNRGLSVWNGRVYTVSTDCQLWALDARDGSVVYVVDTLDDRTKPYSCSGEPRIAGDNIVVGNSGGDNSLGGTRGFISAFDLNSGALRWRFYTVPKLHDRSVQPHLKAAARTWDPDRDPTFGGGGSVWNSMTYDPGLDLLIFGTGNAAPYNGPRHYGERQYDSLYAASIIAVHARTGEYAWHYQTTPGDIWDYDANAPVVLADLVINGRKRKTVLQANKNGYFYVLDRTNGAPISVKAFARITWSDGIDEHFRPIVGNAGNYLADAALIYPGPLGAHGWSATSYSPVTGLVYIAKVESPGIYVDITRKPDAPVKYIEVWAGIAGIYADQAYRKEDYAPIVGALPDFPEMAPDASTPRARGSVLAWDPVAGKKVWEQPTFEGYQVIDGGTLSTAGNLVFAGRADGRFVAYAADTGAVLKVIDTGVATVATPMTYIVADTQYVALMQGYTSGYSFKGTAAMERENQGRILVFKLDGADSVRKPPPRKIAQLRKPPQQRGTPALAEQGSKLFATHCSRCHALGVPMVTPDLSELNNGIGDPDVFKQVVLLGTRLRQGMPRFAGVLSIAHIDAIHAYLIGEAWRAYDARGYHSGLQDATPTLH